MHLGTCLETKPRCDTANRVHVIASKHNVIACKNVVTTGNHNVIACKNIVTANKHSVFVCKNILTADKENVIEAKDSVIVCNVSIDSAEMQQR